MFRIAALLISGACLMVWLVPPMTRTHGFFGCYTLDQVVVGIVLAGVALGLWSVALARAERRRWAAFRAGAVLGALAAGWIGLEVVYGFFGPSPISPFYRVDSRWNLPDPELGFIRKPNLYWAGRAYDRPDAHEVVYRTDQNGFRNPPGITQADIVFVGDSFTEAGNVLEQDTFVRRVGDRLGVTVANLGRGYYGPQQELIVLRRYALEYDPKTIVWAIFEGNDLGDAERYLRGVRQAPEAERPASWPSQSLLIYRLLAPFLTEPASPLQDRKETWLLVSPDGREREVDFTALYIPDLAQRRQAGWQATKQSIRAGLSLCRRRGIDLLVVFLPVKFRVYGPFLRVITPDREYVGPLPEDLSRPDDFGSLLARFCQEIGCRFLDTYPALLAAAERGQTVYSLRYDSHFEVPGHRVVADLIADALADGKGAATPPLGDSAGPSAPPG